MGSTGALLFLETGSEEVVIHDLDQLGGESHLQADLLAPRAESIDRSYLPVDHELVGLEVQLGAQDLTTGRCRQTSGDLKSDLVDTQSLRI